jgi:hypothetical protein
MSHVGTPESPSKSLTQVLPYICYSTLLHYCVLFYFIFIINLHYPSVSTERLRFRLLITFLFHIPFFVVMSHVLMTPLTPYIYFLLYVLKYIS